MAIDLPQVWGGPETGDSLAYRLSRIFFAEEDKYFRQGMPQGPTDAKEGTLEMLLDYPGSVGGPAFVGHKLGRYSQKKKRLQVCFAVPKDLLNSPRFANFFIECLETAIPIAKIRFDKDGIPFDLQKHLGFVEHLRQLDLRVAQPLPWLAGFLNPEGDNASDNSKI